MQAIEYTCNVLSNPTNTMTCYMEDLSEFDKGIVDTTEIDDEYYRTHDGYAEGFR